MHRRSLVFGALLGAILAGCGAPAGRNPAPPAVAERFGDRAPHPWGSPAPSDYPVHGIDISKFQGAIDWPRVARSGISFAYIKATEGGDRVDEFFRDNVRSARRAGVPHGAYHFFYHCRPASEQARWFISHVPREAGALPPVLDIEWTPTSPTCTLRRDAATIRAEIADFVRIVGAHYGQRPVIYATLDFFHDNDLGRLGAQEFWLRSVAAHPRTAYPGQAWTFWQYTATGKVPGITGDADINTFAGSSAQWQAWLASRRQ